MTTYNGHDNIWELPFGQPAELELQTEVGSLRLVPVEPGQAPRLELSHGSTEHCEVHVDKVGETVRVALDRRRSINWFGGWECKAPAHVVYHDSDQPCPWPGCTARIAGINFQLEKMGDKSLCERLLSAWWQGPGLVGQCPGCGRLVLFGLRHKRKVEDAKAYGDFLLPDDWHRVAYIVTKPTK